MKSYKKSLLVLILFFSVIFVTPKTTDSRIDDKGEVIFLPEAIEVSEKWIYPMGLTTKSSPAVIDLDNDGYCEVIITSETDNMIYCLDYTGSKLWNYTAEDVFFASPIAADLDKDGYLEVLVGSYDNYLYCLNYTGDLEWRYDSGSEIKASASVGDLDKDGTLEILFGSNRLFCLSHTGQQEWNYSIGCAVQPAIADLDGDDDLEIVFNNKSDVHCVNHTGQNLWIASTTYDIFDAVAIADLDDNGYLEIVVVENENLGSGNDNSYVYCFNATGSQKWKSTTLGQYADVQSAPTIADLDNDDSLEIIVTTNGENLSCLDKDGKRTWNSTDIIDNTCNPSVADLDNDGTLEVLVTERAAENKLFCFDHEFSEEWNYSLAQACDTTPIIVDIDGDGIVEIIILSTNGFVYCLGLTDVTSGSQRYYAERGSVFGTGQMDSDNDYMDDLTEDYYGTNAELADTDIDGLEDWDEIYYLPTNPLNSDSD